MLTAQMTDPSQPYALFLDESELAKRLLGKRAKEWKAIAIILERKGLPPVDPMIGARYFPAVRRFFDVMYGVVDGEAAPGVDGPEKTWQTYRRRGAAGGEGE